MFGKFFEACTITLGLYCCLQLSSAFSPSSKIILFNLSRLESFSGENLQEYVKSVELPQWRSQTKFNPRVNRY
jgi:hypothetical protein